MEEDYNYEYELEMGYSSWVSTCKVCGRKYHHVYGWSSHTEFEVCSLDCWSLSPTFLDEVQVLYWTEERIEMAEFEAEQMNKELRYIFNNENGKN